MKEKKQTLFVGITKTKELVSIDLDIERNYFSITHHTYDGVIDEEQGREEARERLSTSEYWEDIGMINRKDNFLLNFIDFEEVADHVLDADGWENVNGEYQEIGTEKDNTTWYINFSSCGANAIGELNKDYEKLFITKEEKELFIQSDKLHSKELKKMNKEEKELMNKCLKIAKNSKRKQLSDCIDLIDEL